MSRRKQEPPITREQHDALGELLYRAADSLTWALCRVSKAERAKLSRAISALVWGRSALEAKLYREHQSPSHELGDPRLADGTYGLAVYWPGPDDTPLHTKYRGTLEDVTKLLSASGEVPSCS